MAGAREWLLGKLAETDATVERDVAGNLWATIPGDERQDRRRRLAHRRGAARRLARRLPRPPAPRSRSCARHKGETPAVTLKLIDWADEEGARFGRSLLGSSAAAGTLDPDAVRHLKDNQGIALPDALKENDVDLDTMGEAELPEIAAYLELHIEQGPRLEEAGKPAAAVIGCFGVERHAITFTGKASHAGSRRWTCATTRSWPPARFGLAARESRDRARRRGHDRHRHRRARHPDDHQPALRGHARPARLHARAAARHARRRQAGRRRDRADEGVEVEWTRIWQIDPIPFDATLVDLAAQAVGEITGDDDPPRLPSGALHDAAEVARRYPTVMVFSSSTDGVSHSPMEDTPEDDLRVALRAYGRLYELTAGMISAP